MTTFRHGTAAAVATLTMLALSACGSDSPTGNAGDALNAAEAQELLVEFFSLLDVIDIPLLESGPPAASPARVPYGELYDDQIDGSVECDGGGSASVVGQITGDVDQEAGTADISVGATADFVGCVVPGETTTFTLDGAPDVDLTADIAITSTAITIDISTDGNIDFDTEDGRSGTCRVNFGVAASASSTTGVLQTLSGTVCGVNASSFDVSLFD